MIAEGGGRDCDEAACVLGVNNQHPSEVMRNGREGPVSGVQAVCGCGGGGFGVSGILPPEALHSEKLHG